MPHFSGGAKPAGHHPRQHRRLAACCAAPDAAGARQGPLCRRSVRVGHRRDLGGGERCRGACRGRLSAAATGDRSACGPVRRTPLLWENSNVTVDAMVGDGAATAAALLGGRPRSAVSATHVQRVTGVPMSRAPRLPNTIPKPNATPSISAAAVSGGRAATWAYARVEDRAAAGCRLRCRR